MRTFAFVMLMTITGCSSDWLALLDDETQHSAAINLAAQSAYTTLERLDMRRAAMLANGEISRTESSYYQTQADRYKRVLDRAYQMDDGEKIEDINELASKLYNDIIKLRR